MFSVSDKYVGKKIKITFDDNSQCIAHCSGITQKHDSGEKYNSISFEVEGEPNEYYGATEDEIINIEILD